MRFAHRNDTLRRAESSESSTVGAASAGAARETLDAGVVGRATATRSTRRAMDWIGVGCAVGFVVLAALVALGATAGVDDAVHDGAVAMRTVWLTPIARGLSDLMTPVPLVAIGIVLLARARTRRFGGAWALNVCGVALLNVTLKALMQRPRPDVAARLAEVAGFSFPSGHAATAMAAFGLLAWFIWRTARRGEGRVVAAACVVLAILVGASRVYLGVHYLSDVLAGFCEAGVWLAFYVRAVAARTLGEPDRTA